MAKVNTRIKPPPVPLEGLLNLKELSPPTSKPKACGSQPKMFNGSLRLRGQERFDVLFYRIPCEGESRLMVKDGTVMSWASESRSAGFSMA